MTARPRPLTARPLTAQPRVARRLLEASIGLASLGTLVAGVSAVGDAGQAGSIHTTTLDDGADGPLVAAQATPAALARLDALGLVDLEPAAELIAAVPAAAPVAAVPTTAGPVAAAPTTVATAPPAPTVATTVAPPPPPPDPTTTTTTAAPTPAPAPEAAEAAAAAPRNWSPDEVKAIIMEAFGPVHGPAAIRVAHCESRLNPRAISRGGGNWGLFQLNTVHKARVQRMGYQWEDVLDPHINTMIAKQMFDGSGWRPWACKP